MAKQTINIGSTANDGTGSTLRVGGDLINDNFNEIYTTFGDGSTLSNAIPGKVEGANFTGSILVGHTTTGAISSALANTGVGINSLKRITTGDNNTMIGYNSGQSIIGGRHNTGLGRESANGITSGLYNINIGYQSGQNITSGDGNVIIGAAIDADSATGDRQLKIAGHDGTTTTTWISGDSSGNLVTPGTITANGILLGAGLAHKIQGTNFTNSLLVGHSTTGTLNAAERNTGVGIEALDALTSGDSNTALGYRAGSAMTTNSESVYIGVSAGYQTQSGSNTAVGAYAFQNSNNANSYENTAIGSRALASAGGSSAALRNTALGRDAGYGISSGDYNVVLGYDSGDNITTGSGNVTIGTVDVASATGSRQLAIAGFDGTNTTTWISGDSDGLLTITGGEVIPGKKGGTNFTNSLLVGHSTTGTLSSATFNTGIGIGTLDAITTADHNVAIGAGAATTLDTSPNNVIIGSQTANALVGGNGSNVLIGKSAGYNNVSGAYNVFIGESSGASTSGSTNNYNVGIGRRALQNITTGEYNIALGQSSGDNITTGSGNVVIGKADVSSATGDDQLSISDGEDGSVVWLTGDSSGNVTMTLAANQITSTQLTSAVSLQILSSDGTVVKTLYGAGS